MEICKIKNSICYLLAALFCLVWVGKATAADKNKISSGKSAVSQGVAPLPKPHVRSNVKIPASKPALPRVPPPQSLPVAPPVLNPRGQAGAKPLTPPGPGRKTRPVRPETSGVGASSPDRGFMLSPLVRPKTGLAGQGEGVGSRTGHQSPASGNNSAGQSRTSPVQRGGATRSLLPGSVRGSAASGSAQPDPRRTGSGGFAGDSTSDDSGDTTAGTGFVGPVTEARVPNRNGTTTAYSRDGSSRTFRSYTNSNGTVVDFNDDGSVTLNSPEGQSTTLGNDGSVTTTNFDGSSDTLNQDGSRTRTSVDGSTETFNTDGSVTRTGPGGSSEVVYPDGARTVTGSDGVVETYAADGSISGITSVREEDGSGSVNFPDGSRAEYDSEKNTSYYNADGTITRTTTYADGSEEIEYPNGTVRETRPDGTRTTRYPDGSVIEETGDGTIIRGADGSETFENSPEDSPNRNIKSAVRINADGTVTETYDDGTGAYVSGRDGNTNRSGNSGEQGGASSPGTGSSTGKNTKHDDNDSRTNDTGDKSDTDDDTGSDSNDDSSDDKSDDSAGSDDSSSSDDDSKDSDSGDDDNGSDEARGGFENGRNSDGGPSATSVVDDRVSRMKGEKRDPESPDDSEPGNGGSAPGNVSQPGPGGGRRGSPLARPSAEGHKPLVNGVVVPTVKTRSSVGGGDCFKPEGCDDVPTGGFQPDPFNRDPATNPGGG